MQRINGNNKLKEAIKSQFAGEIIKQTERRAVLHTALRATKDSDFKVDGINVMPEIFAVKQKMEALLNGKTEAEVIAEGANAELVPFKGHKGNKPTNTIFINKLTPESLGKLIAMYDQFGVE
jgi:glucose-6-phosphate isomerase